MSAIFRTRTSSLKSIESWTKHLVFCSGYNVPTLCNIETTEILLQIDIVTLSIADCIICMAWFRTLPMVKCILQNLNIIN
jgi:hypothetical protein